MNTNTNNRTKLLSPSEALNRFILTEHIGTSWSAKENEQSRYGFKAGNLGFVADLENGSEVISGFNICNIPNTPLWFSGVINLRGNLIPVFDLEFLISEVSDSKKKKYLIVIGKGDSAAAIQIGQLPIILRNTEIIEVLPELPDSLKNHVIAAYKQNEDTWLEFNADSLFTEIGNRLVN